jgi:16S rRNA processing protein RimM
LDELIVIGQLGKPHGLRGEMRCRPETDFPERFLDTEEVEIFLDKGPARRLAVEWARAHQNLILLKLVGVDTVEQAGLLRNYLVAVGPDEVVEMDDGYFHYELEGLEVFDESGGSLGHLVEVMANPAHEIYRIAGPGGEILVPAVEEYVVSIDIEHARIVIRPPVYAED